MAVLMVNCELVVIRSTFHKSDVCGRWRRFFRSVPLLEDPPEATLLSHAGHHGSDGQHRQQQFTCVVDGLKTHFGICRF